MSENSEIVCEVKEERSWVDIVQEDESDTDSSSNYSENCSNGSTRFLRTCNLNSRHKQARSASVCTTTSEDNSTTSSTERYETDPSILSRRQKQIDYGKNTIGYEQYLLSVPRNERNAVHPKTPPKHLKFSRRAWDGLIKSWRLRLHKYDPDNEKQDIAKTEINPFGSVETVSSSSGSIDSASCSSGSNSSVSSPKAAKRQRTNTK